MGVRWVEGDVLGEQVELKYRESRQAVERRDCVVTRCLDVSDAPHRSKWLARFIK